MNIDPVSTLPSNRKSIPKWTILHYLAGDNNLDIYVNKDLDEIERGINPDSINIIAQHDRPNKGGKRYFIEKDGDPFKTKSPVIKELGNVNMASPEVLTSFIEEAINQYPAEHYALIIHDHGSNWEGCITDTTNGPNYISLPQLKNALDLAYSKCNIKKLDLIGFSACNMAGIETAYELKDSADYIVGSESVEYNFMWDFNEIYKNFKGDATPEQFAQIIVNNADKRECGEVPTISAIKLNKIKALAVSLDELSKHLLTLPQTALKEVYLNVFNKIKNFPFDKTGKDIYEMAKGLFESSLTDETIKEKAQKVMLALKEAVLLEKHYETKKHLGNEEHYFMANGIKLTLPNFSEKAPHKIDEKYTELQFAKDTSWDEFLITASPLTSVS